PIAISIVLILVGDFGKRWHLPFASPELLLGYLGLFIFYFIRFLKKLEKDIIDDLKLAVVLIICIGNTITGLHWVPDQVSYIYRWFFDPLIWASFMLYIIGLSKTPAKSKVYTSREFE
ncbi:MAG TPA: hypothetical protein VGP43_11185, partial [Chitinophagaceae bacterium]|nr:hypothetical protein [Chitinophagaceae bacterium]